MIFKVSLRNQLDGDLVPTIIVGCFQLSACFVRGVDAGGLSSVGLIINTDNFYSTNMLNFDWPGVTVRAFSDAQYKRNDLWKVMFGLFNCFGFAIRLGDYCSSKRLCLGLRVWPPAAWAEAGVEEEGD